MWHGHIVKTKRIVRRLSSKRYCSKGNVFYNLRAFFIRIVKEKKLLPVIPYGTVSSKVFYDF